MRLTKVSALICVLCLLLCSCTIERYESGGDLTASSVTVIPDKTETQITSATQTVTETETAASVPPIQTEATSEKSDTPDTPSAYGEYSPTVFMYHLIMEKPFSSLEGLFVRPSEFAAQLDALNEMGAEYVFADEYHKTNAPSVCLTFDDGYEDNYTEMFPILKEKGARATIFLISGWVNGDGYLTDAQIKEMADSGLVHFGCHTVSHLDLSNQNPDTVRSQMTDANAAIEAITGKPVKAIAYPAGGYNDTVAAIASEYFDFAYTTESPASHTEFTPYTIPRYRVNRGVGSEIVKSTVPAK